MTRQQAMMTLGLNLSAGEAQIRIAWRKKAKFYHPDSEFGDANAFLQCKAAFETLIPPIPKAYRVRARARAV